MRSKPRLPTLCSHAQARVRVTMTYFRVISSEKKVRNAFLKWRQGFSCLVLCQHSFTVRGCPSRDGNWSSFSRCGGKQKGRKVRLVLPSLNEQPRHSSCHEYVWSPHTFGNLRPGSSTVKKKWDPSLLLAELQPPLTHCSCGRLHLNLTSFPALP